jgi:hypothetical protein
MNSPQNIIKELETKWSNMPFPIMSLYLGFAGKKTPAKQMIVTLFHSLIHRYISKEEQKIFRTDIYRIEEYLTDALDTRGKRSIVFFSAGKKLWEVLTFEFYLPPLCVISYSPYIRPLADALESYRKYIVLMVDRKRARLFTVHMGEIKEQEDILAEEIPQKVRANDERYYGRSDKIFRHIQDHLHRNLVFIADKVDNFVREHDGAFLILGGHKEMLRRIKKKLSPCVQKMILGEFVSELNIPLNEIFLQSKKIAEKIETDAILHQMEVKLR